MVDAVANVALETLRDLLVEQTKFLLSVKGDVKKVETDLEMIHGLLMKADRERSDSSTLKVFVKELNVLAFDAETVLETYMVKVKSKKEDSRKSLKKKLRRYMCIMCECSTVHEVGNDLRKIIVRFAELKTNLESELGQQRGSSSSHEDHLLRQTYAREDVEPYFVGMEKDIESIVSMLTEEDEETRRQQQRVIKMYGMGGLGKTTLARKIYNHKKVVESYGTRAWVCISQQFEATTVLRNISNQLGANIGGSDSVYELVEVIHKLLEESNKKCLIVMDDIWENDHWEIIKPAFPIKSCDVLLTTRSESVAANHKGHIPYQLQLLKEDEGWELLHQIALTKYLAPPTEDQGSELRLQKIAASKDLATPVETSSKSLEDIGREIVVKCGRLPLSISVIGGILRQKEQNFGEWEKVSLHMDSYLRHGEGVTENKRVTHVLSLSYDALPYYLKPCFLYLACFPEDAQIETEELYLLWMAEGFISSQDKGINESLRDVAERYLTELAMRCMVQVHKDEDFSPFEKFDSCGLHDLMHDLCSAKAEEVVLAKRIELSKNKNGIPSSIPSSVINDSVRSLAITADTGSIACVDGLKEATHLELSKYENGIPSSMNKITIPPSVINHSVSRLAIFVDSTAQTPSVDGLSEVKSLRSFMVRSKVVKIRFTDCTIDFKRSRCLRILRLHDCEFQDGKLPSKVSKLIHLRYLSLLWSNVKELPEFVCNMSYLHTLDLRVLGSLRLPNVIWKMNRLRHLFLPYEIKVIEGDKLRLDGLVELETLHGIKSESAHIVHIRVMVNLRKLVVTVKDMDSLRKVVQQHMTNNKSCQTELNVESCDLSSDIGKDIFMDMLMFPSLICLDMDKCNVSGGFPLYEAGMCQNLLNLRLRNLDVDGDMKMIEEIGKYPKLQSLQITRVERMGETESLICRSNSFPQLKNLVLHELPNLKKWQVEEIRALPKLTRLTIYGCRNLEKLPDGLRFISTLQQLGIYSMPEEFKERVRGEDNANISHIPHINID